MKFKGIPLHVCDKAPRDKPVLLNTKLFTICPYCGQKLEENNEQKTALDSDAGRQS